MAAGLMNIVSRLKNMPQLLVALVVLGLLAPVLAFVSVMTGRIVDGLETEYAYGAAKDIYELAGVVLMSVPVFVASILILTVGKRRSSICCYLFGLLAVCLSPLCLSAINLKLENYWIELLWNMTCGAVVGVFLFKSKGVESYFSAIDGGGLG